MDSPSSFRPTLILLLLFGATTALLAFTVDVRISDEAGVHTTLPETLGEAWVGYEVLFCQRAECQRSWLTRDLTPDPDGQMRCPENLEGNPCGGELLTMSRGERTILPSDTVLTKKQYFHQDRPEESVYASIVLSGVERTSIHRPEFCMRGAGHTIDRSRIISVPLEGREPLEVMVLEMTRKVGRYTRHSYYAYWFVGQGRETASHFERTLWMGVDRILRNVAHRWAYIAVSGERASDPEDLSHHEEIRGVIQRLYPELVKKDSA